MEPVTQTILTLTMMLFAYFWGKKEGVLKGSEMVWSIIIDAFDVIHIDWNDDNNHLTFTNEDGKIFKSSEAVFIPSRKEDEDV